MIGLAKILKNLQKQSSNRLLSCSLAICLAIFVASLAKSDERSMLTISVVAPFYASSPASLSFSSRSTTSSVPGREPRGDGVTVAAAPSSITSGRGGAPSASRRADRHRRELARPPERRGAPGEENHVPTSRGGCPTAEEERRRGLVGCTLLCAGALFRRITRAWPSMSTTCSCASRTPLLPTMA